MKISVLIAAYRAAPTVARAIASVRTQTHGDWEIVVVEDGSDDGTGAIAKAAAATGPQAVRYERSRTNQGVAATRNRLMQLATGDVLAFLDADDWWSDDHLRNGAGHFAAGAGLVVTGVRTFDLATGQAIGEIRPPAKLETDPVGTLFDESVIVTSSCVLLSREARIRTGCFDGQFQVGEDRDYWLRAGFAGASVRIEPAVTCHYAKHAGSTMGRTLLVAAQTVRFYEKHFHLFAVPAAVRRHRLAHSLANEARLLRATDARSSARRLWRAWCLTPGDLSLVPHLAFSGGRALFRP
jgi:cellulose synthase/poly-beta-1,6-N-acetylglucosamine synthase-like glycosyltransferase